MYSFIQVLTTILWTLSSELVTFIWEKKERESTDTKKNPNKKICTYQVYCAEIWLNIMHCSKICVYESQCDVGILYNGAGKNVKLERRKTRVKCCFLEHLTKKRKFLFWRNPTRGCCKIIFLRRLITIFLT